MDAELLLLGTVEGVLKERSPDDSVWVGVSKGSDCGARMYLNEDGVEPTAEGARRGTRESEAMLSSEVSGRLRSSGLRGWLKEGARG